MWIESEREREMETKRKNSAAINTRAFLFGGVGRVDKTRQLSHALSSSSFSLSLWNLVFTFQFETCDPTRLPIYFFFLPLLFFFLCNYGEKDQIFLNKVDDQKELFMNYLLSTSVLYYLLNFYPFRNFGIVTGKLCMIRECSFFTGASNHMLFFVGIYDFPCDERS